MANGITKITVQGFKSLYDETSIEIRPLTILAGANSSGKSSIMQPLLLMKQTLESNYDAGTFKLDSPNVNFSSASDFLSKSKESQVPGFSLILEVENVGKLINEFLQSENQPLEVVKTAYETKDNHRIILEKDMLSEEIQRQLPETFVRLQKTLNNVSLYSAEWIALRNRCFLDLGFHYSNGETSLILGGATPIGFPVNDFSYALQELIHLPGLRGNPQRVYPTSPVTGPKFDGTFEKYTAAVLSAWMNSDKSNINEKGEHLAAMLRHLGLASGFGFTFKVESSQSTSISILVQKSKSPDFSEDPLDLVNIADVGLGVSQILPVLVALLVAEENQMVYIEQPELHLHPRAQVALAEILAEAANRGVRVVIETHSSLLIQGVQTLIAQKKLDHEKVILHWFTRDEDGKTHVDSRQPDELGATGDLPEDFSEVELNTQSRYMEAVEKRELEQFHAREKPEMPGD